MEPPLDVLIRNRCCVLPNWPRCWFPASFFSRLVNCKTQRDIRQVFSASASEYWTTHYCFGQPSGRSVKRFGDMMLDNLGINLVVPMIFAYGKITGNEELKERAIGILEEIRAENHIRIVREWKTHGIAADNAFFLAGVARTDPGILREKTLRVLISGESCCVLNKNIKFMRYFSTS